MPQHSADFWIDHLHLTQHIEGGWFSEVYRSDLSISKSNLPGGFHGDRNACTHIYFLLKENGFSAFHKIQSDELWHFYDGDPLIIYELQHDGTMIEHLLGRDPSKGQQLFCVIKAGNWFGSRVARNGQFGLAGCTVSPGFDFADFEMANRQQLLETFPVHTTLITSMTY